jgi:hypothetical protein
MLIVLFALLRPRVWLGVVVANIMVMMLYLWRMTTAVLDAVILLPPYWVRTPSCRTQARASGI